MEDYIETPAGDGYSSSAQLAFQFSLDNEWFWREATAQVDPLVGDCVLEGMAHANSLL